MFEGIHNVACQKINWENMDDFSSIAIECRFVDEAYIVSETEAYGIKLASSQDWYFKIHFPGNPILPGVFLVEIMQQTGSLLLKSKHKYVKNPVLRDCQSFRIFHPVRPGASLVAHVVLDSLQDNIAKFHGEIIDKNNDQRICTMKFSLSCTEEEKEFQNTKIKKENMITINFECVDKYIAVPIEYRFIDEIQVEPAKLAIGKKLFSHQEWYFKFFHDILVAPAFCVMEATIQTGVFAVTTMPDIRSKLLIFHSCNFFKIYRYAHPGEILNTYVTLKSFRNGIAKFQGVSHIENKLACEIDFMLIMPDMMPNMKKA